MPTTGRTSRTSRRSRSSETRPRCFRSTSRRAAEWELTAVSTASPGRHRTVRSARRSKSRKTRAVPRQPRRRRGRPAGVRPSRAAAGRAPTYVVRGRRHPYKEFNGKSTERAAAPEQTRTRYRPIKRRSCQFCETRSKRSTTRTRKSCGGTSPRRGRSARAHHRHCRTISASRSRREASARDGALALRIPRRCKSYPQGRATRSAARRLRGRGRAAMRATTSCRGGLTSLRRPGAGGVRRREGAESTRRPARTTTPARSLPSRADRDPVRREGRDYRLSSSR